MVRGTAQEKITPPGSFTKDPPISSPSVKSLSMPVSVILQYLKAYEEGQAVSDTPWVELTLRREEYSVLLEVRRKKSLSSSIRMCLCDVPVSIILTAG